MPEDLATVRLWRCRRCKTQDGRDHWATRYGILECASCLWAGYVGLLEPVPGTFTPDNVEGESDR